MRPSISTAYARRQQQCFLTPEAPLINTMTMKAIRRTITPEDVRASERLKRLWDERKTALHLTQHKAALELGTSQAVISQWLSGRTALGFEATVRLAALLKVHVREIRPELGDVVDDAAGGARLDTIINDLPVESQRMQLHVLRYNLAKSTGHLAAEKIARYTQVVDERTRVIEHDDSHESYGAT